MNRADEGIASENIYVCSHVHEEERIYLECDLDDKYKKQKPRKERNVAAITQALTNCFCSGARFRNTLYTVFPILCWLRRYDVKKNLLSDITAGFTVGIVQIPQGMAYALLADLPPIVGMYVSFFPVILYPIVGTSKHVSIGTFAVVSILISGVMDQRVPESYCGDAATTPTDSFYINTSGPPVGNDSLANTVVDCKLLYNSRKLEVAVALSIAVGLLQVMMSLLRLGIVTVFLSESLVSGFVSGASIHVITSQIPKLFGITIPRSSGPLALVKVYVEVFKNIRDINLTAFIISVICTIFLVVGKVINAKYRKKLPLAIPWELAVVIFSTIASRYGNFEESKHVVVVGEIPTGIVTSVPRGDDIAFALVDSIPISIVAFTVEISLCQMFATKHAYEINSNQELLALGACNVFGAFFSCFPSAASLSRSVIYEEMGGKTQLGGVVSSAVVLSVLLWIGPLFEPLPQASLAVIIIVNIKSLVLLWGNVKPLWKISRLDALTWMVAWFSVVLLGVDIGLIVGVAFSLLTVIFRTRSGRGTVVREVAQSGETYRDVEKYETLPLAEKLLVFQFSGPLYFANTDRFTADLVYRIGFDPVKELAKKKAIEAESKEKKKPSRKDGIVTYKHEPNGEAVSFSTQVRETDLTKKVSQNSLHSDTALTDELDKLTVVTSPSGTKEVADTKRDFGGGVSHVIVDMGMCPFIDSDGAKVIRSLYEGMHGLGMRMFLASCNGEVKKCLRMLWKDEEPPEYVSLQGAVHSALSEIARPAVRSTVLIESD